MNKSRIGSEFGFSVLASFILLFGGIMMFFFPFTLEASKTISSGGKSSSCTLSLLNGEGTAKCPVDQVNIFKNKIEINGKKSIDAGNSGTQIMAKEAIAKLLVSCLSRGGGYNSRSFSRENTFPNEIVCLECFDVKIDGNVGNIEGLTDYLRDTKSQSSVTDKKYLEVLTRDQEHLEAYIEYGTARHLAPPTGTFILKPNKEYVIYFMGIKQGKVNAFWSWLKDIKDLEFFRAFLGNNDAYFTYLVESDRLNGVCDRKIN